MNEQIEIKTRWVPVYASNTPGSRFVAWRLVMGKFHIIGHIYNRKMYNRYDIEHAEGRHLTRKCSDKTLEGALRELEHEARRIADNLGLTVVHAERPVTFEDPTNPWQDREYVPATSLNLDRETTYVVWNADNIRPILAFFEDYISKKPPEFKIVGDVLTINDTVIVNKGQRIIASNDGTRWSVA